MFDICTLLNNNNVLELKYNNLPETYIIDVDKNISITYNNLYK